MKVDRIYIFTDAPIPIGFAATNRILSYASGFEMNNVNCEIIVFRKSENFDVPRNTKVVGKIGNTTFKYLFNSPIKSKRFLRRRIDNLIGLIRLFLFALKLKKKSVIIYYSSYTRYALILKFFTFYKKILLIKEESEFPDVYKKSKYKISWLIFNKIHYALFNDFLVMTSKLVKYFEYRFPKVHIAHIPMTVDLSRFKKENVIRKNYITYVGSLNNEKDGVLFLLNAFSNANINNYKLLICAFASSPLEKEIFLMKVKELKLNHKVEFRENVSRDEIPYILMTSKVVVLPRPDSIQAQNGFPTKLGEYLASGTPTIVTSVGDIPNYLEDGVSSFLIKPGNIDELKEKMEHVIKNYSESLIVGKKGKIVAEKFFNNVIQTKKIIEFINVWHNR